MTNNQRICALLSIGALFALNGLLWCLVLFDNVVNINTALFTTLVSVIVISTLVKHLRNGLRQTAVTPSGIQPYDTFIMTDPCTISEPECSICLLNYKLGEELCRLKCKHVFHLGCFVAWNKDCPFRCHEIIVPQISTVSAGRNLTDSELYV